jgi:aldehyde dehydrogenase (NAD+)
LNVVTADREVSELLVRDPRVDKITFTGSTAAGRRIASICGDRIARCTLELGGKSAAVILDDIDIATAAGTLAANECVVSGQVCSSLTRIVVTRNRHDEFVDALTQSFARVQVGDPFDPQTQMGPLAVVTTDLADTVHR